MRDPRFFYRAKYSRSRALVIGVNAYQRCGHLDYAVNDAEAVRDKLINNFGFEPDDVTVLLDADATSLGIRRAFFRYSEDDVEFDDRLLIFFAGHGATREGAHGDIGFLIPVDGHPTDLASMIRWDELTRNSEVIRAKHILFIMDACYGGLAVTRAVPSGSTRFLKDMLKRLSRQVLTAGKADEPVADSGGPLPGHSVFTGHLLEGMDGLAETGDGVITATGLMAYVYGKVSRHAGSYQTPHYGHIFGDGDFIFKAPSLGVDDEDRTRDVDSLLVIPYPDEPVTRTDLFSKVARVKKLLSEPDGSIELHDFAIKEVKVFLANTNEDFFNTDGNFSVEEMLERLTKYESSVEDLSTIGACIAYWATESHRQILKKMLARSTDRLEVRGGLSIWLHLRWYPLILQTYCAGIAAVEAGRYDILADIFSTEIEAEGKTLTLMQGVRNSIGTLGNDEIFKLIPGHNQQYTPMSEYLFKHLQPSLDDALFVGKNYERAFDEFEMLLALVSAHDNRQRGRNPWGPIGRFGWKNSYGGKVLLEEFIERIDAEGNKWPGYKHGLFGGDPNQFRESARPYLEHVDNLNWF